MVGKNDKTKTVEKEKKIEGIVPKQVIDILEHSGKPYVVIMKDTDSVLAKKAAKAKIDYRTNIEGSAFINLLQTVITGVVQQANQAVMQQQGQRRR